MLLRKDSYISLQTKILPQDITEISEFLTERYIQEGLHQYLEIEQPRAMLQIEQVVTQAAEHLIDRVRIPIVERGVRGQPPGRIW